jgi:hypothetical protein
MRMIRGAPTICVDMAGAARTFIVDTGSSVSFIQPGVSSSGTSDANVSPIGVTGANLGIEGEQEVEFSFRDWIFRHTFYVCSLPTDADGLVGMNLLMKMNARLDIENLIFEIKQDSYPKRRFLDKISGRNNHVAFTVFPPRDDQSENRARPTRISRCDKQKDTVMMLRPDEINIKESEPWMVKTTKTIRLVPRAKHMIMAMVDLPKRREKPQCVCVEPAQLPIEGVLAARALSRTIQKPASQLQQMQAKGVMTSSDKQLRQLSPHFYAHFMVTNFTQEEIVLPVLGVAEQISEALVAIINSEEKPTVRTNKCPDRYSSKAEMDQTFKQYMREGLAHLTHDERKVIEPVLIRYRRGFMMRRIMISKALIWSNIA